MPPVISSAGDVEQPDACCHKVEEGFHSKEVVLIDVGKTWQLC